MGSCLETVAVLNQIHVAEQEVCSNDVSMRVPI